MITPDKKGDPQNTGGHHEHPLPREIKAADHNSAEKAHAQADHDIAEDPDFSMQSPNDDLDEGESALLGEDVTDII